MMTTPLSSCLIVFTRNPVAGQVKTRLIPAIGADGAARLHRAMTQKTLDTAACFKTDAIELWLDGPTHNDTVWLAPNHRAAMPVHTQQGDDLGERMLHAMRQALLRHSRVLLIGTDCPAIDPAYLDAALDALNTHDVVVGPAADGGYVLIGATRLDSRLFDRVPWGSANVLSITRERLRALGWSWQELAIVHDVDEIDDLKYYPELLALATADAHLSREVTP